FDCNFETDICGWEQLAIDEMDWTRNSGPTSTGATGPDADHTLGTAAGNYMYYEADDGANEGDTAILASITIDSNNWGGKSTGCVSFWYSMYGNKMGTLAVQTATPGSENSATTVWTLTGDQGNTWIEEPALTIDTSSSILFKGTRGNGKQSDMAIDDVAFGDCPGACYLTNVTDIAYIAYIANIACIAYIAYVANITYFANLSDIANISDITNLANLAYIAYIANISDITNLANLAYIANITYVADFANSRSLL
ncbi:hypothetical protein BaRGS_00035583, partial [Batillaria attramentaria]